MNLSNEQVNQLFAFTEKKMVRSYDLQVELVDHLGNKIEEEMEADKSLTFDTALQKVYASFGLFGFAHVVQEHAYALQRRNRKMWWTEVKSFFTIPKVIFTIMLFFLCAFVCQFIPPMLRFLIVVTSYFSFSIFFIYDIFRKRAITKKRILLIEAAPFSALFSPVFIYEHFLIFKDYEINNQWVFALIFVLGFIIQASILELVKKMYKQAQDLYPEAFALS
jgi:hypothetical protein